MAKGYTEQEGKVAPPQAIHMSVPHAAGALIGSVEDLAKWNAALHHGKVVRADLLRADDRADAAARRTTEQYGFGIAPREVRGRKALGHGGGIFGFSTDSIYLPKEDVFVAVFTNSDDPKTDPGMVMHAAGGAGGRRPLSDLRQGRRSTPRRSSRGSASTRSSEGERRVFLQRRQALHAAHRRRRAGGLCRRRRQIFLRQQPDLVRAEARCCRHAGGRHVPAGRGQPPSCRRAAARSRPSPRPPTCRARRCRSYVGNYAAGDRRR